MKSQIDELVQKITVKADTKALDVVQRKENKLIATTNALGASFKSAFRWIGGGLLFKSILDSSMQLDSLTRSFDALAGSSQKGGEELAFLRAEAERLGQSFPSIAEAYKGLFATGVGANMDRGVIRGVFSGLLEASTVLGTTEQETQGAIIALQQMVSKGKVMAQELRLQLGNALPGAFQIAAKAMGVSTAELEKMVSKGLDAKEFVQKFGQELHRQFGGAKLEKSVHSIRAEFTRLKNAIFDTKTGLFSGDVGEAFADVLKAIRDTLISTPFKVALKTIANLLALIFKNFKLIASTFIIGKFLKLITATQSLGLALNAISKADALNTLTKSMKTLSVAGWSAVLPFAKLALMIVAVHDLIVALFDKDLNEMYQNWIEKHPFLSRITNPGVLFGDISAGVVQAFQHNPNNPVQFPQSIQQPQVVQTNNIYTQNIDQNMLDERIKGQVRGLFLQTVQGGAK